jgi:hypothetical protein
MNELETERASWVPKNAARAFASPLKLVLAGYRDIDKGTIQDTGLLGIGKCQRTFRLIGFLIKEKMVFG